MKWLAGPAPEGSIGDLLLPWLALMMFLTAVVTGASS